MVTHESDVAERAEHIMRLKDGRIESVTPRGSNGASQVAQPASPEHGA